jgi:hypothetical protein
MIDSASSPDIPGTHSMGGVSSNRLTPNREAGPKAIDISWLKTEFYIFLAELNKSEDFPSSIKSKMSFITKSAHCIQMKIPNENFK